MIQSKSHKSIVHRVILLRQQEMAASGRWARGRFAAERWFWMLYHEFLRDDVKIRAQSLAFLTLFSLLPLTAGAFFVFTFLAQFGMVQAALQHMADSFLASIPLAHRQILADYVLHFKDAYLANLTHASGSVGVFAILILGWVGLQTFNNIDATLNFIWSADRGRPLYEKIRNFIVVAVVAPITLTGGFSIPLILYRFPLTRYFFEKVPLLGVLLNYVLPSLLILAIFLAMYRFVPVRRVQWRAALCGALFATLTLELLNLLMRFYFAYGTNSAYGKAAVVPLIGFWIYALWIVVILGAEVSFLIQNGRGLFVPGGRLPTLGEGRSLLCLLAGLRAAFRDGSGPVSFERARELAQTEEHAVRSNLRYLLRSGLIAECHSPDHFVLARDIDSVLVAKVLRDFFQLDTLTQGNRVAKTWRESLLHWIGFFENQTFSSITADDAHH